MSGALLRQGSNINVLLCYPPTVYTLEALEAMAAVLHAHSSIASVSIWSDRDAPTLHVRMFAGLHFELSIAAGRPAFDVRPLRSNAPERPQLLRRL